jgi:hypothetical protein
MITCILILGTLVNPICLESKQPGDTLKAPVSSQTVGAEETGLSEYILVLEEKGNINNVIDQLDGYDARVIKDLGRGRFLIGLKLDPGIEQLTRIVEDSDQIRLIQPNYNYGVN